MAGDFSSQRLLLLHVLSLLCHSGVCDVHVCVLASGAVQAAQQVLVSSLEAASVLLAVTSESIVESVTLSNSRLDYTRYVAASSLTDNRVIVWANVSINVQVLIIDEATGNSAAYEALHVTSDMTSYTLTSYSPVVIKSVYWNTLSVLALRDDVTVGIYSRSATTGALQLAVSTSLNVLQTMNKDYSAADVTGLYINATGPITVIVTANALVPSSAWYADIIADQLPPTSAWGTVYLVSSIPSRGYESGFRVRVLAGSAQTSVSYQTMLTGSTVETATLQPFTWQEKPFAFGRTDFTAVLIKCSQPCLVAQYAHSYHIIDSLPSRPAASSSVPGPTLLTVPAIDRLTVGVATFTTPAKLVARRTSSADAFYYIAVVVQTEYSAGVFLDGRIALTWRSYQLPGLGSYSVGVQQVTAGARHTVASAQLAGGARLAVLLYGQSSGLDIQSSFASTVSTINTVDGGAPAFPVDETLIKSTLLSLGRLVVVGQSTTAPSTTPRMHDEDVTVSSMSRSFGLLAGGTLVTFTGTNLADVRVVQFGDKYSASVSADPSPTDSSFSVFTPAGNESDLNIALPVTLVFADNSILGIAFSFSYRLNPQIADIQPRVHIYTGGTLVTVTGQSLDTAAKVELVAIVSNTDEFGVTVITTIARQPCTVFNSTFVVCLMPRVDVAVNTSVDWSVAASRRRRQVPPRQNVDLSIHADSATVKPNISIALIPPPNITFVSADPLLQSAQSYEFSPDDDPFIRIKGSGMRTGSTIADYHVLVGAANCTVQDLTDNELVCRPPSSVPLSGNTSVYCTSTNTRAVLVYVGFKQYFWACLEYYQAAAVSSESTSSFNTPLIAGVVVASVAAFIILLLIIYCWRKQSNKTPQRLIAGDKTIQQMNFSRPKVVKGLVPDRAAMYGAARPGAATAGPYVAWETPVHPADVISPVSTDYSTRLPGATGPASDWTSNRVVAMQPGHGRPTDGAWYSNYRAGVQAQQDNEYRPINTGYSRFLHN